MLKFSYFTKARPCNVVRVLVYLAIKECFLGLHTLDSFSPSVQQSQTTACRHGPRYPTSFPPHFWTRTREEVVFSLHLPGWLILSTHQSHCWIIRLDINMNMNQVTKDKKSQTASTAKAKERIPTKDLTKIIIIMRWKFPKRKLSTYIHGLIWIVILTG